MAMNISAEELGSLILNDPEVKKLAISKIKQQLTETKRQAAGLEKMLGALEPRGQAKAPKAIIKKRNQAKAAGHPGSKGHREAIMAAIENCPGMNVSEIREALIKSKHEIGDKVLSTLLHGMKTEWETTNGQKGLRTSGGRGSTIYFSK